MKKCKVIIQPNTGFIVKSNNNKKKTEQNLRRAATTTFELIWNGPCSVYGHPERAQVHPSITDAVPVYV